VVVGFCSQSKRGLMINLFLIFSCIEKRIIPEKPRLPMTYKVSMITEFTHEADGLALDIINDMNTVVYQDMSIILTPNESLSDDSIWFDLHFINANLGTDTEQLQPSPLEGQHIQVRLFPWGELLMVTNFENVVGKEMEMDVYDIFLPALFPNPPRYKKQQWSYRILPWPMKIDNIRIGQQFIEADWTKVSNNEWQYTGQLNFDANIDNKYPIKGNGPVNGTVQASDFWIDFHELNWKRSIEVGLNENTLIQHQNFTVIVKRES
jgi:hypothetical protein